MTIKMPTKTATKMPHASRAHVQKKHSEKHCRPQDCEASCLTTRVVCSPSVLDEGREETNESSVVVSDTAYTLTELLLSGEPIHYE